MAKLMTVLKCGIAVLLIAVSPVGAQTADPKVSVASASVEKKAAEAKAPETKSTEAKNATTTASEQEDTGTGLTELPDLSATNQIPLLNNRFRIDYEIDEITLVFFRKKGAPSVVLVKPDGSKVYARTAKDHQMEWHDDKTYDLIKIKQPTPGPWQAIGSILPESRIMVLTDIDLQVDPLPTDMMVGETLKVTARLTNGGKPMTFSDYAITLSRVDGVWRIRTLLAKSTP